MRQVCLDPSVRSSHLRPSVVCEAFALCLLTITTVIVVITTVIVAITTAIVAISASA